MFILNRLKKFAHVITAHLPYFILYGIAYEMESCCANFMQNRLGLVWQGQLEKKEKSLSTACYCRVQFDTTN
jgi:hypothetical protein